MIESIFQDCLYLSPHLSSVIIKAEKSHDMPSVSWRPRKVNGVVPVLVQGVENLEH